jgi:hypothetical protein
LENWTLRREREREKHRNGNGFGTPLAIAARLWHTPTAVDARRGDYTYDGNDPIRMPRPSLLGQAKGWPTPTVDDANQGAGGKKSGVYRSLTRAVIHGKAGALWATPAAHERTHAPRLVDHGIQLANQVEGRLNPDWVEPLMGYPANWTVIAGQPLPARSSTGNRRARSSGKTRPASDVSPASVTRSSRRSSK